MLPIDMTRSLPSKMRSSTFQSPLLCPPGRHWGIQYSRISGSIDTRDRPHKPLYLKKAWVEFGRPGHSGTDTEFAQSSRFPSARDCDPTGDLAIVLLRDGLLNTHPQTGPSGDLQRSIHCSRSRQLAAAQLARSGTQFTDHVALSSPRCASALLSSVLREIDSQFQLIAMQAALGGRSVLGLPSRDARPCYMIPGRSLAFESRQQTSRSSSRRRQVFRSPY